MIKQIRGNSMTGRNDDSKTFFSQWGPFAILCGVFFAVSILLLIAAPSKPGFPGFAAVFQRGDGFFLLIPAGTGILLWLFFSRRIRFEPHYAVIYYCTVFPVRIDYAEVTGMIFRGRQPKYPDAPAAVFFQLGSGKIKSWNLSLFSGPVSMAVKQELECRIPLREMPKTALKLPDIQKWTDHVRRPSRAEKIVFAIFAVIAFLSGFCNMAEQLAWDGRVRTWDKADGVILKNTTKQVGKGKSRKTVADVEYRYTYKGRKYTGTRIVYDSSTFPALKVGTHRKVIVNPENPQDCAVMFWYRGHWGLIRWIRCAFCYLLSIILFGVSIRMSIVKKITVPDALKNYIESFPPERFYTALQMEQPAAVLSDVELNRPMEYRQDHRYGILRQHDSKVGYIAFGALLLAAVTASIFVPLCWLLVALIGFAVYSLYAPRMAVFDFQEKKILFRRRFRPESAGKMKSVSFTEVEHLSCSSLSSMNRPGVIGLFAVKNDGSCIPICRISVKRLALLFDLLPELAEKMGHLPITYF